MSPMVITLAVFFGVSALVGGVAVMFRGHFDQQVEDRLDLLTCTNRSNQATEKHGSGSVLAQPFDQGPNFFDAFASRFGNLNLLLRQADTNLSPSRFLGISVGMACVSLVISPVLGMQLGLASLMALLMGAMPFAWLLFRRKRRLKRFAAQLPDTLD